MTAPLTPASCDLRGLDFMPLDVVRLLDSDTLALLTGDEFKAAFQLWCRSWKEVPAASLRNDDRILARAAGVALSEWQTIKAAALRGWVECDDGRIYHPVVAEKALRAWIERIGYRDRSAKAQSSRHESFTYQPEGFADLRAEAVACLEVLSPNASLTLGAVLRGGSKAPARNPSRSDLGSEEKGSVSVSEVGEKDISIVVSPSASPTPDARQAFNLYNEMASEVGIPTARDLTPARAKKLTAYLKEEGLSGWESVLEAVRQSPHCLGRNDRQWKADLDFLLTPSRRTRLLEGSYAHASDPRRNGGGQARSYLDTALEAVA